MTALVCDPRAERDAGGSWGSLASQAQPASPQYQRKPCPTKESGPRGCLGSWEPAFGALNSWKARCDGMFLWLQHRVKQTCRPLTLADQPAKQTCFRFTERPCLQPWRWQAIEERHTTSILGLHSWAHITYQRQHHNTNKPPTCTPPKILCMVF